MQLSVSAHPRHALRQIINCLHYGQTRCWQREQGTTRVTRPLRIRLGKHFKWPPPVSASCPQLQRHSLSYSRSLDPRADDAHYGSIIFNLLWSPNWRSLTARNCGQVVFQVVTPLANTAAIAAASKCHQAATHTHTHKLSLTDISQHKC